MRSLKHRQNKRKFEKLSNQKRFDFYSSDLNSSPRTNGALPLVEEWAFENPNDNKNEEIFIYGVNSNEDAFVLKFCVRPQNEHKRLIIANLCLKQANDIYEFNAVDLCSRSKSYKIDGLSLQIISPFRKARIVFRGILRKRGDNDNKEKVFAKIRLFWSPLSGIFDFSHDFSASLISKDIVNDDFDVSELLEDRYEQYGQLKGTVQFESDPLQKVFFWGNKCKKFSDVDSKENKIWKRIFGYSCMGLAFHFGFSIDNIRNQMFRYGHAFIRSPKPAVIRKSTLSLENADNFSNAKTFSLKLSKSQILDVTIEESAKQITNWCSIKKANVNGKNGACIFVTEDSCFNDEQIQEKLKFKVDLIENDSESEKLVINIENWSSRTIAGGKGLSLSQLSFISRETWNTLDFPNFFVPQGVIVTTNAYSLYLKQNPSVEKAIDILQNNVWKSTSEDIKNKCESVINLIKNTQLPTEVKNEILNQLILIFGEEAMNSLKFAVRSSSCSEDSEEMSAAGQMSSFLGIKRIENIYTSVLDCWASQFSYVAVQYKHGYGQLFNTQMAVVIQEMIDCDVAGVLFTCNPVNGDGRRTMITANYGLCESVVSAKTDPDTLIVLADDENKSYEVESVEVGSKKLIMKVAEEEGTFESIIDSSEARKCCLDAKVAIALTKIGLFLRRCFGTERDIEWGIKEDKIYLLQSRPITNLDAFSEWEIMHELDSGNATEVSCLTRTNVGEAIPGSMSYLGLTFFISLFGPQFYYRFKKMFHSLIKDIWSPVCIPFSAFVFNQLFFDIQAMSGFFRLNNSNLKKASMISTFGHEINDEDIEKYFDEKTASHLTLKDKINSVLFVIKEVRKCAKRLRRDRERFQNYELIGANAKNLSAESLFNHIIDHVPDLYASGMRHGECTQASNSANLLMISILTKNDESNRFLYTDVSYLLSNCKDVVSVEIPRTLCKIADSIENVDAFSEMSDKEALHFLTNENTEVGQAFKKMLQDHGHRGYKEVDIMYKQWEENPLPIIQSLKSTIHEKSKLIQKTPLTPNEIISSLKTPLSPTQKLILRKYIYPWGQKSVGYREQSKSFFVYCIHKFRKAFWQLAEIMAYKEGRIPEKELLFYLKLEEVAKLVRERDATLVARAKQRRKLFPIMDKMQFDEIVKGPALEPRNMNVTPKAKLNCEEVKGSPVYIGKAEGRAIVAHSIEEACYIKPGDILITFGTDVGWSLYFPMLSGIATEVGGLISHGAVIAREYGLPCIIGATNATQIFKTGDRIVLDSEKGIIYKVVSD